MVDKQFVSVQSANPVWILERKVTRLMIQLYGSKNQLQKPSSESSFVRCSMFLGQLLAAGKPQQAYELGSSIGDGSVCRFRLTDPLKPVICALTRELDS